MALSGKETYETQCKDEQGRDSMCQHSKAKDVDMLHRDEQVPQKVSSSEGLDQSSGTGIAMDLARPVHLVPVFIFGHDPQCEHADDGALHKRYDVHIPIKLGAGIETAVYAREDGAREGGSNKDVDGIVQGKSEEDFVDVQRESLERDVVGEGFGASS